ncbi:hypothetical protein [Trinickia dinghuensis]|uniref:Uncharacterized protein n=1 Tax=Trinickia dinghuensis TaxID=2291023 RepID=A0A3D8K0Q7_9BURK|nr:hypothetical protein [Trinickia dinghuensis]RDU99037.1 hypothetical protein DWV00_12460 [Trinickia dinghuensis]
MTNALIEGVKRYTEQQTGESPFVTAIDGVTILRSDHERHPSHLVMKPALCVVWLTLAAEEPHDARTSGFR